MLKAKRKEELEAFKHDRDIKKLAKFGDRILKEREREVAEMDLSDEETKLLYGEVKKKSFLSKIKDKINEKKEKKRQRVELMAKLGQIRATDRNRKFGAIKSAIKKEERAWLIEDRKKELAKLDRINAIQEKPVEIQEEIPKPAADTDEMLRFLRMKEDALRENRVRVKDANLKRKKLTLMNRDEQ